jgi:hypothetical protein
VAVEGETLDEMLHEKIELDGGGWTGSGRPRWMPLDTLPCRFTLDLMIQSGKVASRVKHGIIEIDLYSLREFGKRNQKARQVLREVIRMERKLLYGAQEGQTRLPAPGSNSEREKVRELRQVYSEVG